MFGHMIKFEKPKSVEITIRNRKTGKNKSFTVYNTTVDEVFETVRKALKGYRKTK